MSTGNISDVTKKLKGLTVDQAHEVVDTGRFVVSQGGLDTYTRTVAYEGGRAAARELYQLIRSDELAARRGQCSVIK